MRTEMKPPLAPPAPGNMEWERFDNTVGRHPSGLKDPFLKEEAKVKRQQKERGSKKPG